jgi:hypothetical protein
MLGGDSMNENGDEISLGRAEMEFRISKYALKKAADAGIIHMQLHENHNVLHYLLSRGEIQKNLESIKKPKKDSRLEMEELIKKGIRGVAELERHGIPTSTIYQFYPRPVATNKMFYCLRLNTWTPACRVDNCGFKGKCK